MQEIITAEGLHKWTIERIDSFYVFTLYEKMGSRWVMLGTPEVWSAAAALELLDDLTA